MKTYSQKPKDVQRGWYLIDASTASFGRVATTAAGLLIGKGKPTVTPHTDGGDFVVIINADNMVITGGKLVKKNYHYHSGYPGGLRTQRMDEMPRVDALEEAIRGMLPVNRLRRGRLARLKIYAGGEHQHAAQKPRTIEVKGGK